MNEYVRAYEGQNPYLFVSYSHKDSALVLPFIKQLYERKYRVWYDEGIAPGSEWPKNIADHLQGCSGVIIFVSNNSLASKNCENEVVSALNLHKEIIEISLDGCKHPKLNESYLIDQERLLSCLNDKYLGDGSGYDRQIVKAKHSALWLILIALAIILIIVIVVALYGVNAGWFDEYLPGLNPVIEEETSKESENIEIKDSTLLEAVAEYAGRDDLTAEIELSNEAKFKLCEALGYDVNEKLTYSRLKSEMCEQLYFNYAYQEFIELMTYLPNLKEITIDDGEVKDISLLKYCKKLERVNIAYKLFELELPDNYDFEIHVINYQGG